MKPAREKEAIAPATWALRNFSDVTGIRHGENSTSITMMEKFLGAEAVHKKMLAGYIGGLVSTRSIGNSSQGVIKCLL